MNCADFHKLVPELIHNLPMLSRQREEALEHLRCCRACDHRWGREKELEVGLARLREETLPPPSSRVEEQLAETFRQQKTVGAASHLGKTGHSQIQSGSWRPTLLRIAALIPLVLAAIFFWSGKRDSQQQTQQTRQIVPPVSVQQRPATSRNAPALNQTPLPVAAIKKSPATRRALGKTNVKPAWQIQAAKKAAADSLPEPQESLTDFLVVTPMDETYPSEYQQAVRVKVPRSAMARFGLPVNMERWNEPVQADVVLNQQGMIRAVRFVK